MERDVAKPPKKVLLYEDKFTEFYVYVCENCGEKYTHNLHNYCPECGQKWREHERKETGA